MGGLKKKHPQKKGPWTTAPTSTTHTQDHHYFIIIFIIKRCSNQEYDLNLIRFIINHTINCWCPHFQCLLQYFHCIPTSSWNFTIVSCLFFDFWPYNENICGTGIDHDRKTITINLVFQSDDLINVNCVDIHYRKSYQCIYMMSHNIIIEIKS